MEFAADVGNIEFWASLLTLTVLELVLGIDNLVFIALVVSRMPREHQRRARQLGLGLALGMRVGFLMGITWLASLKDPLFSVGDHTVSARDLVLFLGGLFLLVKGTLEIHHSIERDDHGPDEGLTKKQAARRFAMGVAQIVLIDFVFSFDSVITAVGMSNQIIVMILAVVIAMAFMLFASGPTSRFVGKHPTVKMLALAFIMLVGVALVADGLHFHIPREYLYVAIAFSIGVEGLNLLAKRRHARRRAAEAVAERSDAVSHEVSRHPSSD
ncbi:MAG: TerC family protein [Alphaproteobacteria bacterium]|nr:TerC family protein [Alphaproteobacteria bacterium]